PVLNKLNILHLHSPQSAITSAIIFNALIIIALIPLALRGVRYRPASAQSLLRRNLWIYGVGGLIIPFIGIKLIDLIIMNIPGFGVLPVHQRLSLFRQVAHRGVPGPGGLHGAGRALLSRRHGRLLVTGLP